MLSDTDIRKELGEGIIIHPFYEESLTPLGYDLRVGDWAVSLKDYVEHDLSRSQRLRIAPNDTVVIETLEQVELGKGFSGTLHSMVTMLSAFGITHISTTIDPGTRGKLLIQFHNPRGIEMELRVGDTFCTICFYRLDSPAQKSFNKQAGRNEIKQSLIREVNKKKSSLRARFWRRERFWYIFFATVLFAIGLLSLVFLDDQRVLSIASIIGVVSLFILETIKQR